MIKVEGKEKEGPLKLRDNVDMNRTYKCGIEIGKKDVLEKSYNRSSGGKKLNWFQCIMFSVQGI